MLRVAIVSFLAITLVGSCCGGDRGAPAVHGGRSKGVPRVAILEVRLKNLPPPLATQLRAAIFRQLVGRDYRRVIAEEIVAARLRELNVLVDCYVGPCLSRIGKQLGAERIITGTIAAQGSSYDVLLSLLDTEGGTLLGQVSSRCDVCTFQDLEALVGRAVGELHRPAR
jgi:hypothetical protein